MTRFRSSSPNSPEARHDGGVARATRPDSFLVTLADSLRPLTDALEIQAVAVGLLGKHLGVDRAFYATIENDDGDEHFVVQRAFHAPGAIRISGRYPLREFSRTLHDEARNGRTMVASDILQDQRFPADVLEKYRQLGMRSYVGVPLVKDGRWVASVGVHCETPRDWRTEEIRLVEEVAERTWAAVERAKAEEASRVAEERYRGIVNQAVAGIAEIDLEGNFLTVNDRFCELTGYTRDRLFSLNVLEITHPKDREASREKLDKLLNESVPFEIEKRYLRPDGSSVWVLNSVYSIRGANGTPQSMAAFVIDISERKRAETRLKRSESMMSTLVESAPFGIYFIDSDFRLMSVNRGAAAVFEGISPLIGRNFEEILREVWDEPFATEAAGHFHKTLETGEPFHSQAADEVRAGGLKVESYDWQIHRITLPDGKYGVVCYFYDLTKQKQLEATVRNAARLDAFRVRLTEALLAAPDRLETQSAASCLLGEELGASRAMYFEVRQGAYVVETDYCKDVQSVVGWHSANSFGPTLLEVFQRGEVAVSCDTANDTRLSEGERSAFESIGIGAYIAVPILKDGVLAAGMSVHAATPRDWSPESISLARETAERTWAAVERIRAEELARTIDQRLRVATDAAELGTWEWHFETGRLFWNERHFTMMGLEPIDGPITSSVFFERVHHDDVEYLNRELRRSIDFGAVFDAVFRVVLDDGSIRWMSGYGKRTDSGNRTPAVMSGVVVDITDRMNIEEELRESNERLRLLIESATDCSIFTTDRNGVINTWNSGSSRIYGYEEDEILGRNVEILFTPEDRRKRMHEREMETAIEMGRALDERWHMRKNGTRFYASGVTQPLGAGGAEGFVKIARDMTERLRADQSAREREMLRKLVGAQEEERKRIARDLHDELGQQLTALRLKLDRIGDAAPGSLELTINEVKEIAKSIDEGVDFLAWELRPAALDDLGLIPALESYLKEWSSYSGVEARLNAAMHRERRFEPAVETAMYRIVQESLNNVHKHASAKLAEITLTLHEGQLVLVIEDDGSGFEPDDPEIRRKGMGLIGIHERVQILGGTVEIESRPGNGTTIYVRAPIER